MMERLITLFCIGLGSLAFTGCAKKEAPAAPAASEIASAPPLAAPTTTATQAEPTVDVASLPVEEQYEADAETEITADNVAAKVDELDKELAAP